MRITIRNRKGENTEIEANSQDHIEDLRLKISKLMKKPIDQQYLIYDCTILKDGKTLNDYNIINGSSILFIKKKHFLLLKKSKIFIDSSIIDRIHQSYIDLKSNPDKNDISNLFIEAFSYLDEKLDINTTEELFSIIQNCFFENEEYYIKIIQRKYQNQKSSSLQLIILSIILSNILISNRPISTDFFNEFKSNSIKEILPQVKNNNSNLTVMGVEIEAEFKNRFIISIALLNPPTEQIVATFYPYFFTQDMEIQKTKFFIQKANEKGLLHFIPESEFMKKNLFLELPLDVITNIIQILSEENFKKILPNLENVFVEKSNITPAFSLAILKKCNEMNIKPKLAQTLIDNVDDLQSISFWEFLNKFDFKLKDDFLLKIKNLNLKTPLIMKSFKCPENLPREIISYSLLNADNLEFYDSVFQHQNIKCDVLSKIEFWKHIFSLIKDSTIDVDSVIDNFLVYFQKNVDSSLIFNFYDQLIFDNFPPNQKQSSFLVSLLNYLPNNYSQSFHNPNNDLTLVMKLLKQKKVPFPKCIELFNFQSLSLLGSNQQIAITPQLLFELAFSSYKPELIRSIEIMPMNGTSEKLIKFIETKNDYSCLADIDDESLSLIACSLYFITSKQTINVCGLNVENIIPFLTIAVYSPIHSTNNLTPEMMDLLIQSINSFQNNQSPLAIASINSILSDMDFLTNVNNSPLSNIFKFDILCSLLINDEYKADKRILIIAIFKLSFILSSFPTGIELFKYIFQSFPDFINDKAFHKLSLNLKLFDKKSISEFFTGTIENSTSYEPIYQAILFYNSFCKNKPILKFQDESKIHLALQKDIYEDNWDHVSVIINFMKSNKIKIDTQYFYIKRIPHNIINLINDSLNLQKIDDLITLILSEPNIETKDALFLILFKLLKKDRSTLIKYLFICLEKITNNQFFNADKVLSNYTELYRENTDDLVYAIRHNYNLLGGSDESFVRKTNIDQLAIPEPNYQFLARLINIKCYQSFVCLQNIASSFPFFFEPSNTDKLLAVEIVLPTLSCVSSLFEEKGTNETIENLKTAFAGLSFLFSCLYSTKFISKFVPWLFENIDKLDESQVFCFSHILISLFRTSSINNIIVAYAVKYNFCEIVHNLLSRNISNESFKLCFQQLIYELASLYYESFSSIRNAGDVVFVDNIMNIQLITPFENAFNNFMSLSQIRIKQLNFNFPHEKKIPNIIYKFIEKINKIQPFWIFSENSINSNYCKSINPFSLMNNFPYNGNVKQTFLNYFRFNTINLSHYRIPVPRTITTKFYGILLYLPNWALKYFENPNSQNTQRYERIPDYQILLTLLTSNQNTMKSHSRFENDDNYKKTINPYTIFPNQIKSQPLFDELAKNAIYDENNDFYLFNLIAKITNDNRINNDLMQSFTQRLSVVLSNEQMTPEFLLRICNVFKKIWKNNKQVDEDFIEKCGDKIIDITLSPSYRTNNTILSNVSSLLSSLKCSIPIKATHIIGLIFSQYPDLINQAINLYLKIGDDDSINIFPIIQYRYKIDVDSEIINYNHIYSYLDFLPKLAKSCIETTYKFFNKIVDLYKNTKQYDLQKKITELLNKAAPEPNRNQLNNVPPKNALNEENESEVFLYQAPEYIKQTSPFFWENFYEKNRIFLNEMITNDHHVLDDLYFIFDYTELLSFQFRYSHLKNNFDTLLESDEDLYIHVSRSRIVLDSFSYWIQNEPKEFLGDFQVSFDEEEGSDQGGLTREWLTYLMKELFDPKLGMFIQTESKSYHINSSLFLNSLNSECLKMTGAMIAFAMIKKTCINVHLSIPLLKTILHQKIQLEDLESFDVTLYNSLKSILESNDAKQLDLYFSIDDKQNDKVVSVNLIENGDKIQVTNENKKEYVDLYIDYKFNKSISEQMKLFIEGFESFIDPKLLKMFTPKELDLIICGKQFIDVEDMKANVHFEGNYHKNHLVIKMFFNVISKWSQDNLSKLLLFITGSSYLGVNGFKSYQDNDCPIIIGSFGTKNHFPAAHTCSNQLDLPSYDNEKEMNDKLLEAIQECKFGFA